MQTAHGRRPSFLLSILFAAVLLLVGFGAGSLWGFKQGIANYSALESVPVAVISLAFYDQIENGDTSDIQSYYDAMIDHAIDSSIWYETRGNKILSNLFLKEHLESREDYINEIVDFRKRVPQAIDELAMLDLLYQNGAIQRDKFEATRAKIQQRRTYLAQRGVDPNY